MNSPACCGHPHELTSSASTFFLFAVPRAGLFPFLPSTHHLGAHNPYKSRVLPLLLLVPLPRPDVYLPSLLSSSRQDPIPMSSLHSTQPLRVPGPSSASTSKLPHLSPSTYTPTTLTKRRRPDSATDADTPSTGIGPIRNTRKDILKKKKAARACIHCQRAHLTCDDCALLNPPHTGYG